ncbi:MAG TPA: hypothetical protein VIH90_03685 [Candidatus Saccharimonadales bacterium]
MGKLVTISTSQIRPSQDFLKDETIEFILKAYKLGNQEGLPPTPIVRIGDNENDFIAIDGHNLIAVWDYLDKPIEVYVAESEHDKLQNLGDKEAVEKRNNVLGDKYENSLNNANDLRSRGITSFRQLRQGYPVIAPTIRQASG